MKWAFGVIWSLIQHFLSFIFMILGFMIFLAGIYALKDGFAVMELIATVAALCVFMFGLWLQVRS
jgi:hypothetical protein